MEGSQCTYLPRLHARQRRAFCLYSQQLAQPTSSEEVVARGRLERSVGLFCSEAEDAARAKEERDNDPISLSLKALHVDDFGFGDVDLEVMCQLREALLELLFVTLLNVSVMPPLMCTCTCLRARVDWI